MKENLILSAVFCFHLLKGLKELRWRGGAKKTKQKKPSFSSLDLGGTLSIKGDSVWGLLNNGLFPFFFLSLAFVFQAISYWLWDYWGVKGKGMLFVYMCERKSR